jgi:hypothetical protein
MIHYEAGHDVSPPHRQEIFRVLVLAQDMEMSLVESRRMIADRFGLSDAQIRRIEREGLEAQWPPL